MTSFQEQYLSLSNQFIQNTHSHNPKLIQTLNKKLTILSKQEGFLQAAIRLVSVSNMNKQNLILTTSLIKDKFKFQIQILGVDKLETYYQGLVTMASHINFNVNAIYSNISLSLAYIFITISGIKSSEISPLEYLQLLNKAQLFNYYIKTLEYIASQVDNSKFVIDQRIRSAARQQILKQQINILSFLNNNSQQFFNISASSGGNIIRCFQVWIEINYQVQILNSLPDHAVFKKLHTFITQNLYIQQTTDCLKTIIYQLYDMQHNLKLFQAISSCCMQLIFNINKCLQQNDSFTAQQYLKVVAQFFKKNIQTILDNYDNHTQNIIQMLASYIGNKQLESFQNLIQFFQCFLDNLIQMKENGCQISKIIPIIDFLYENVCKRTRFDADFSRKIQSSNQRLSQMGKYVEQMIQKRQQMLNIYLKISVLLGKRKYLELVLQKIQKCSGSVQQKQQMWLWLQTFLYSIIDPIINYPELDENIMTLIQLYIQSDQGDSLLIFKRTALKMIRNIFTVVDKKDKQLELVTTLMAKVVDGLKNNFLFGVSEKAFLKGCQSNGKILQKCFDQFVQILNSYPLSVTIIQGIANVLVKNQELFQRYFKQIMSFLLSIFNPNQIKKDKKTSFHGMIKLLDVIKSGKINKIHKSRVKIWLKQNWNILMQLFTSPKIINGKVQDIDQLTELVARLLKYSIKILQQQFSQFVQNMFDNAETVFKKHPICTYLYLIQISVSVLHTTKEYKNYHYNLFNKFTIITSQHLTNGSQNLSDYDNLLDDFISLSNKLLLIDPAFMLNGSLLPIIIDIAVKTISNGQNNFRAAKSSCFILQTIFRIYWPQKYIDQYNKNIQNTKCFIDSQYLNLYLLLKQRLLEYLQKIIEGLLLFLSSCPNQRAVEYIMDCIEAQIRAFYSENPQIWTKILSKLSSQILVISEKQKMITLMQKIKLDHLSSDLEKQIFGIITLINRRMINSYNRKLSVK